MKNAFQSSLPLGLYKFGVYLWGRRKLDLELRYPHRRVYFKAAFSNLVFSLVKWRSGRFRGKTSVIKFSLSWRNLLKRSKTYLRKVKVLYFFRKTDTKSTEIRNFLPGHPMFHHKTGPWAKPEVVVPDSTERPRPLFYRVKIDKISFPITLSSSTPDDELSVVSG